MSCPDPFERGPLVPGARASLAFAPAALEGAVLCVICRDTGDARLDAPQRITHLPVTPFVSLSLFRGGEVGLVEEGTGWRPFPARAVLSGSQSRPQVSWSPAGGRAVLVLFTVEVARQLLGVVPSEIHDRFVAAHEALAPSWWPLLDALQACDGEPAVLAALERHLAPRWQELRGAQPPIESLRQVGQHWLERLAWQAGQWGRTRSPRQVERRIKSLSGRSLREWQSLLKAEGVFFSARDRYEAGLPFDWPGLAADEGFADQAHLVRAVKRITGFSPTVFTQRYLQDESFWLYRLWV
jgi:hypothetical protein